MRMSAKQKMKKDRGETLVETLVALLIGALAMALLASMILASTKLTRNSETSFADYYAANNEMAAESASSHVGSGSVTIGESGVSGSSFTIGGKIITVDYYINDESGDTPVVSYSRTSD